MAEKCRTWESKRQSGFAGHGYPSEMESWTIDIVILIVYSYFQYGVLAAAAAEVGEVMPGNTGDQAGARHERARMQACARESASSLQRRTRRSDRQDSWA